VISRFGACAALSGGFILAGSSVAAAKLLTGLPVFFTAAAGAAIAFLALCPLAAREVPAEEAASRRAALRGALPLLAIQAFFGVALFRVLMLLALARTSAAVAGIAMSAAPAITTALAALFLKERIGPRTAAGICLAALGIAALQSGGAGGEATGAAAGVARGGSALAGCLLALGAAASESVFNVLAKRLPASIGPRLASAAVMGLAALMLGILSFATGEVVSWGDIGLARLLAIAYMGFFSSALAYILWYTGVARLPVSIAGVFSGLMPLSSFALSIAFLGERPRAIAFLGSALAIGGVLLCAARSDEGGRDAGRQGESAPMKEAES
jgi:drug/metabolite transporter (DMT)-like permease